TLFATHYHELIAVTERLKHAENFSVAVKEKEGEGIVFLYKIMKGAVDRSYGIEVARLAGLPPEIIAKAKMILNDLEEGILDPAISAAAKKQQRDENQMDIFVSAVPRPHRAIEELKKIDVNEITPLEALKKIDEWQKEL
ncbi:MAG: DNA mismatch repair protein MutS, partial [Nanoarchaeota archaeon]